MANADRKHFGPGMQGKGDGSGAMTDIDPEDLPANMVLKNRDVKQHSEERGLDSRAVQTDRMEPHQHNQVPEDLPPLADERDPEADTAADTEADIGTDEIPPEDEP